MEPTQTQILPVHYLRPGDIVIADDNSTATIEEIKWIDELIAVQDSDLGTARALLLRFGNGVVIKSHPRAPAKVFRNYRLLNDITD